MARSFAGIAASPYIGVPYDLPAQTRNNPFGRQPSLPPTVVQVSIPWLVYNASSANPNVAVDVNSLQFAGPRQLIDRITSVRIDNLGNPVPVYVYFPDTQYTVVAPPFTVVWEPVQTGQFSAIIVGEGFATGQVGSTTVYFCNFFVPPVVNYEFEQSAALYLASANISRGNTIYNENYGTPALGDQFIQSTISFTGAASYNNTIFNGSGTGYIYITEFTFYIVNMPNSSTSSERVTFSFQSTGAAGVLWGVSFTIGGSANGAGGTFSTPGQQRHGNFKLDATQTWEFSFVAAGGSGVFNTGSAGFDISYTTNPN